MISAASISAIRISSLQRRRRRQQLISSEGRQITRLRGRRQASPLVQAKAIPFDMLVQHLLVNDVVSYKSNSAITSGVFKLHVVPTD